MEHTEHLEALKAALTAKNASKEPIRINPSSLTFDWADCHRCFYIKTKLGVDPPRKQLPRIFGSIHKLIEEHFDQQPFGTITGFPAGKIVASEGHVVSRVIEIAGVRLYISGTYDSLIELDGGGYGLTDFKTSLVQSEVEFYQPQLNAYAYSSENPAEGNPILIDRLGLAVFSPNDYESQQDTGKLIGKWTWGEVKKDYKAFMNLLGQVALLLSAPIPLEHSATCQYGNYLKELKEHGLI